MKNQQKTPLRAPLLAALDKEYAEASRRKDLDRMAEIVAIVDTLHGTAAPPPPLPVAEGPIVVPPAARSTVDPPAEPLPLPAAPTGAVGVTLQQILKAADPAPIAIGEADRRTAAKNRLKDSVLRVSSDAVAQQIRYELAVQVRIQNIRAMTLFRDEAGARGMTVAALADRIIAERHTSERRVMHAHAVLARVTVEIDQATGDGIEAVTDAGIAEIEGID